MKCKSVYFQLPIFLALLVLSFPTSRCLAVNSKITRHSSSADLLNGETKDVIIGSKGTLQLGRAAEVLAAELADVWSINSIVISGGTVFIGTSPNGGIYKYMLGKLTKIYPQNDTNEPNDANTVEAEQHLSNEHVFAMATDVSGRLLAGVSSPARNKCMLMRFEQEQVRTIFEPNDAKYIFAIAVDIDGGGDIYLGTGPQGRVYKLDSFGSEAELIYESPDKNILSLAIGQDGFVYAGSDTRGLIYKIDPHTKTATVLYDSDQPEITALLFAEDGELYAAATSAKIARTETRPSSQTPFAGRPDIEFKKAKDNGANEGGLKLEIANTKQKAGGNEPPSKSIPPRKPAKPAQASYIYKITSNGFVTDIFGESAVFFCMAKPADGGRKLFVGTGNKAQLFTVDPDSEEQAVVYEDKQASQITAVAVSANDVYLGTANPAKLIKLDSGFASEGTFTSGLIDAGQPAKWGKLQIEADIPQGCKVLAASRSGNVKDVNDPTFSDWTEPVEITEPLQLRCPNGRFCQYKLTLQSSDGTESPVVREIAVADTVPNLAPKVESVNVARIEAANKTGVFKISYKAKDDNNDKLIYKIEFRKIGRTNWIEIEDKIEADSFEWDSKTVEDGRYEIRVTANDERDNTTTTKLIGSRISDPVVVDNAGPMIDEYKTSKVEALELKISDELSAIGKVEYTIDSNAEWIGAMPVDMVYDTTEEDVNITIEKLTVGEHIITIKARDAVGNTTYRTFDITVNADN
ncbi:MAG: hypothetical protein DRP62_01640 [Planctomycetota bacterium]|nr:MAG: hypothetical protein DRP62_01640 [Planctomycetota bacterium]